MQAWVTKIWLPLLLLALVAAVYFEFSSVKTIELDSGYGAPPAIRPQVGQRLQRSQPKAPQQAVRKSRLAAGERFASLEELVNDQVLDGYLKTGSFGDAWPATVAEILNTRHGIAFIKRDGTRHSYTGFEGYRMRMVRLNGGERETIVVFRSLEKSR